MQLVARKSLALAMMLFAVLPLGACQFQPLYASPQGAVGTGTHSLSGVSVAEVNDRDGQLVRNHLIFLISGGAEPVNPAHEIRLRVSSNARMLAASTRKIAGGQIIGNTAGSLVVTASYDIYDLATRSIIASGSRSASAAFDRTSQSFASDRAARDATERAARAVAEQLRLAIAADLGRL